VYFYGIVVMITQKVDIRQGIYMVFVDGELYAKVDGDYPAFLLIQDFKRAGYPLPRGFCEKYLLRPENEPSWLGEG
jgi:hypothetical protein